MSAAYREKNGVSSIGFRGCVVAGAALMTGAVFPFLERQAMRDYDMGTRPAPPGMGPVAKARFRQRGGRKPDARLHY